jgi:hypothetical protein
MHHRPARLRDLLLGLFDVDDLRFMHVRMHRGRVSMGRLYAEQLPRGDIELPRFVRRCVERPDELWLVQSALCAGHACRLGNCV